MEALGTVAQCVPTLCRRQAATHCVPSVRMVQRPRRDRRRLINTLSMLPIAVDAMGGDAPGDFRRPRRPARHPRRAVGPADLEGRGDLELIVVEIIARTRRRQGDTPQRTRTGAAGPFATARHPQCVRGTGATMVRHCSAWAASRVSIDPRLPPRSPFPARPRTSCSTPAPTPRCSPSGWCSSVRWAPSTPVIVSGSNARPWGCCRSARNPARATRCAKKRSSCCHTHPEFTSSATSKVATSCARSLTSS